MNHEAAPKPDDQTFTQPLADQDVIDLTNNPEPLSTMEVRSAIFSYVREADFSFTNSGQEFLDQIEGYGNHHAVINAILELVADRSRMRASTIQSTNMLYLAAQPVDEYEIMQEYRQEAQPAYTQFLLLDTLGRIGSEASATAIADVSKRWNYIQPLELRAVTERAIIAIYAISLRRNNEISNLAREQVATIANEFNVRLKDSGNLSLPQLVLDTQDLERLALDATPQKIAEQYNRACEGSTEDDDLYRKQVWERDLAQRVEATADPQTRVGVIRSLRELADQQPSNQTNGDYFYPDLELKESSPAPYAPTLGIEIEIYNPALPPLEGDTQYQRAISNIERIKLFTMTEILGVPHSPDGYWEFANAPVHHPSVLSREVQALMDMGLISRDHRSHPIHLTIGGVKGDTPAANLLARALEASNWSCSAARLMKPHTVEGDAWAQKGTAGIKNRNKSEMAHDTAVGIEIRTQQLISLTGLHRTLSAAYHLGACAAAFQEEAMDAPLREGASVEEREVLSNLWQDFSENLSTLFEEYGLYDPDKEWATPNKVERGDFGPLADLLQASFKDKDSTGREFVGKVRALITDLRVEAAPLLKPLEREPELV